MTGQALDLLQQSFPAGLGLLRPRPGLQQQTLPSTWFMESAPPRPPRGHVAGAAGCPNPVHVQDWNQRGGAGGNPKNGMLGFRLTSFGLCPSWPWSFSFGPGAQALQKRGMDEGRRWRKGGDQGEGGDLAGTRGRSAGPARGAAPGWAPRLWRGGRPGGLVVLRALSSTQTGCGGGGSGWDRGPACGGLPRPLRAGSCSGPRAPAGLAGNKGDCRRGRTHGLRGADPQPRGEGLGGGATSVEGRRTPGDRTAAVRRSSRHRPRPRPRRPLPLVAKAAPPLTFPLHGETGNHKAPAHSSGGDSRSRRGPKPSPRTPRPPVPAPPPPTTACACALGAEPTTCCRQGEGSKEWERSWEEGTPNASAEEVVQYQAWKSGRVRCVLLHGRLPLRKGGEPRLLGLPACWVRARQPTEISLSFLVCKMG